MKYSSTHVPLYIPPSAVNARATSFWIFKRYLETFTATNQADFLPTDVDTVLMKQICDLPLEPAVVPLCQSPDAIQYQIPGVSTTTLTHLVV